MTAHRMDNALFHSPNALNNSNDSVPLSRSMLVIKYVRTTQCRGICLQWMNQVDKRAKAS